MSSPLIAPSVLAADFSELGSECEKVLQGGADWLHLDVMDGHFVPNISFGFPVISALRKKLGPEIFFDVHIMVSDPVRWVSALKTAGASNVTFHVEALASLAQIEKAISAYKAAGLKVSLALKPGTEIFPELLELLKRRESEIFMVLIMTVEPGFGGQKFMTSCLEKVRKLRSEIYRKMHIQVDGGLNPETASLAINAGADVIVAGTSVFAAADPRQAINALRTLKN